MNKTLAGAVQVRRWAFVVLFACHASAAPWKGYRYNNVGALEEVRDVTSDVANCGGIGRACVAGEICCDGACCSGTCNNGACCPLVSCASWQVCGQASNACGNFASCMPGCVASERCAANACFEDRANAYIARTDNASNDLVLIAGNRWDMEVTGLFASSRGSFATAMAFQPVSQVASCNLDQGIPGCPQYTLECTSCPGDPNATPGELSCWCNPGTRLTYPIVPRRTEQRFSSRLFIDANQNRRSESQRSSAEGAGDWQRSPVRYYPILPNGTQNGQNVEALLRFEWEDELKPPDGDYNDYVGALATKDCDGTLFPPTLPDWFEEGLSCQNNCKQTSCPPGDSRPNDLRVHAAVGVDNADFEGNREATGKMVTVSVAVYGNPMTTQRMAVCPVAWFGLPANFYNCSGGALPDELQQHDMGASGACKFGSVADIACSTAGFDCGAFPVALAREQLYGPLACKTPVARSGPGDSFELPVGGQCGASATLLDFQIRQELVDAALKDGKTLGLAQRSHRAILGLTGGDVALQKIDLYLVDRIANPDFRCPSGVNVNFGDVDAQLGRVRKFTLTNENLKIPGPQFTTYVRK